MKAAILQNLNHPLVIDEVKLPDRLEPGQVLVKVYYSGICGSQIGEIDGVKGYDNFLPHLLGHEGSGEVIETGPGVRHVNTGDHVVMHWRKGDGIDAIPPVYYWRGQKLNAGFVTTFNEYAVVSENRLTSIPTHVDMKIAALFGCAVTTGFGVVTNNANLKIGESIVVLGAGGIGLNIIQAAAMTSAYPIIAVDLHENRLELAKEFGATHCINASKNDIAKEVKKIVADRGVDVAIDNTGNTDMIALAYNITHGQGRAILVGVPAHDDNISIYSLPLHFGKVITGSFGGETNPTQDIPRYLRLYEAGRMNFDSLITSIIPLNEINTAIEDMRSGKIAGRCMIEMNT